MEDIVNEARDTRSFRNDTIQDACPLDLIESVLGINLKEQERPITMTLNETSDSVHDGFSAVRGTDGQLMRAKVLEKCGFFGGSAHEKSAYESAQDAADG